MTKVFIELNDRYINFKNVDSVLIDEELMVVNIGQYCNAYSLKDIESYEIRKDK